MNPTKPQIVSWLIAATLLLLAITLKLLPALLAGLLVHELVLLLAGRLSSGKAKLVAVVVIATLVILTLTLAGIARAHLVVVTVAGAEKAAALAAVAADPTLPAARIAADQVVWLVDHAAAAELG